MRKASSTASLTHISLAFWFHQVMSFVNEQAVYFNNSAASLVLGFLRVVVWLCGVFGGL